jgi:ribA/ribD-fused uncharacterized protein
MDDVIGPFEGKYRFLSNFYSAEIEFEGLVFPSVENAYQAAKTTDLDKREDFLYISAVEAKKLGMRLKLREDWDLIKKDIMYRLLVEKFKNPESRKMLLATGDKKLIEKNWWHDLYWGCDEISGEGQNWLGFLLMKIRSEIKKELIP